MHETLQETQAHATVKHLHVYTEKTMEKQQVLPNALLNSLLYFSLKIDQICPGIREIGPQGSIHTQPSFYSL